MTTSLQDIPVNRIDGSPERLDAYRGKVLLVVNVASKCGLTPQYTGLQALHERFAPQGFSVLGFPANDFGGQEPGTNEEIQGFCSTQYDVKFPMFAKIAVTGEGKHPLYQALTAAAPVTPGRERMETRLKGFGRTPTDAPEVVWNFEKFLIGKDGQVAARFAPDTAPDAPEVTAAIEKALAA